MKNRIIASLLAVVFLVANVELAAAAETTGSNGTPDATGEAAVTETVKTGFVDENGKRVFYEANGVKFVPAAAGAYQKDGKYYYFNNDGAIKMVKKAQKLKVNGKYYYFNADSTLFTDGWKTVKKKKNYFTENGAAIGWKKIGKYRYYFTGSGNMKSNTIVGKYYVNKKGQRVTDPAAMEAVKVVKKVSKNKKNNTKEKKLRACYNYVQKYPYERVYEDPRSKGKKWYSSYANYMFTKKKGNCYKYASCFAYCAKVLGYDSYVVVGRIWSSPHGWAEIKTSSGKIYTYDPNMQRNKPGINSYKRTYRTVPYPYTKYNRYKIAI